MFIYTPLITYYCLIVMIRLQFQTQAALAGKLKVDCPKAIACTCHSVAWCAIAGLAVLSLKASALLDPQTWMV